MFKILHFPLLSKYLCYKQCEKCLVKSYQVNRKLQQQYTQCSMNRYIHENYGEISYKIKTRNQIYAWHKKNKNLTNCRHSLNQTNLFNTIQHLLNKLALQCFVALTHITVRQYGNEFQASSCILIEPLGARIRTKLGTLLCTE